MAAALAHDEEALTLFDFGNLCFLSFFGLQSVFKEAPVNLKQPENVVLCESVKVSQNRALIALCCVQAELADVRSRGTSIRTLARREKHKPPIETPNVK